ncbi:hypothetical protein HDU93_004553 [Gonapodya sp. JEL0774]|nr:hypothetical protein HDU93_004553 [Gonapodya sp. JEL0774]
MPRPPTFKSFEEERKHRKQRLAAALRIFAKYGYDEGVAGHFTVRDPEHPHCFWVNAYGQHFSLIKASDLILVNESGEVVVGNRPVNAAAFAIHSQIHKARPDVVAAAHSHSMYGKTWASLGRKLDPISQDSCAFYEDHEVFEEYDGVVVDTDLGAKLCSKLGTRKALVLQNHGFLTVESVDGGGGGEAKDVGTTMAGWFSFQPYYDMIVKEQPDLLD